MITEDEVFSLGFRSFGIEEKDPYYKVILKEPIFDKIDLSGYLSDGKFVIYGLKTFDDINELKSLFILLNVKIDKEITNKYGSEKSITKDVFEYKKSAFDKNTNEFIVELLRISEDKRKLPLVITAPNGELHKPTIKMLHKDNYMFNDIEKLVITI